jgi:hypothetical protein
VLLSAAVVLWEPTGKEIFTLIKLVINLLIGPVYCVVGLQAADCDHEVYEFLQGLHVGVGLVCKLGVHK